MAGRGRRAGFQMGAEHRTKIANSKILKHLIEHAEGTREMTGTQVTAGLGLLDRVMPKLAQTTLEGGENPIKVEDTGAGAAKVLAALEAIAERSGTSGEPDA